MRLDTGRHIDKKQFVSDPVGEEKQDWTMCNSTGWLSCS